MILSDIDFGCFQSLKYYSKSFNYLIKNVTLSPRVHGYKRMSTFGFQIAHTSFLNQIRKENNHDKKIDEQRENFYDIL